MIGSGGGRRVGKMLVTEGGVVLALVEGIRERSLLLGDGSGAAREVPILGSRYHRDGGTADHATPEGTLHIPPPLQRAFLPCTWNGERAELVSAEDYEVSLGDSPAMRRRP